MCIVVNIFLQFWLTLKKTHLNCVYTATATNGNNSVAFTTLQQTANRSTSLNPTRHQTAAGSTPWYKLLPFNPIKSPGDQSNNNEYLQKHELLSSSDTASGGLSSTNPNVAVNTVQKGGKG